MKILTMEITKCRNCPFLGLDSNKDFICQQRDREGSYIGWKVDSDNPPSWCPLPEKGK